MKLRNFILFSKLTESAFTNEIFYNYESEIDEFSYSPEKSEISRFPEYEENEAEESYFSDLTTVRVKIETHLFLKKKDQVLGFS